MKRRAIKKRVKKKLTQPDILGDYLLAYRYMYYCRHTSLISDKEYDLLEKEYKRANRAGFERLRVGSDKESTYHPAIRALALYLALRGKQVTPKQYHDKKETSKKKVVRRKAGCTKVKIKRRRKPE